MNNPLVSVIVPTFNSYNNLKIFLNSFLFSKYRNFEIIINDDKKTNDKTADLIEEYLFKGLKIIYIKENILMAQARKKGAEYANGEILIFLDSDMKITENLLGECVKLINSEYDALVIPEESYGENFWAKCKWLEKKCYIGVEKIESLRCIKKDIYFKIGGHNEKMVFSEDKDLDIRVRKNNYKIGRTINYIYHNEGKLKLTKNLMKKFNYSKTANLFAIEHPKEFKWQINIINRYLLYIKNIKYLFIHPILYIGIFYIKTCEVFFGSLGFLMNKYKIK